jgi:hypothetical protein
VMKLGKCGAALFLLAVVSVSLTIAAPAAARVTGVKLGTGVYEGRGTSSGGIFGKRIDGSIVKGGHFKFCLDVEKTGPGGALTSGYWNQSPTTVVGGAAAEGNGPTAAATEQLTGSGELATAMFWGSEGKGTRIGFGGEVTVTGSVTIFGMLMELPPTMQPADGAFLVKRLTSNGFTGVVDQEEKKKELGAAGITLTTRAPYVARRVKSCSMQ